MSKFNCTCSRYCRVHGTRQDITEVGYSQAGIHTGTVLTLGDINSDVQAKEMLCKIIHDQAIKKLCKDNSLMITSISEQIYGSNGCIGTNYNCDKISISLRYNCNTFLKYFDIIAILIHELVHHSCHEHDENFKKLERVYRTQYIANARVTGQFASWIPIEFPESTGSGLMIGHSTHNKPTSRFYVKYLLVSVCSAVTIYVIYKKIETYIV